MKIKKLPSVVFVRIEDEGEDSWLLADDDPGNFSERGARVLAGRYVLQEEVQIMSQVTVEPRK